MGVTFVIGRSGSGKTSRCFRSIVAALRQDPLGEPIYWLLPQQATFQAERELTCASGLGGFCRARVLSFDQLAVDIMAECGGIAVPQITRLGRQMILGHLLRRHEADLRFFSKVARHPGLASRLEAAMEEFERCGKDPAQLGALIKELASSRSGAEPDPLHNKLHDLQLIYKAYCDYLGQERLDPRRRMEQVLACIARSRRFRGSTIYVDGFWEFDEFQRRMLAALAKVCGPMEITLLMDPGSPVLRSIERPAHELSLFHRVEETYRRLARTLMDQGVALEEPVLLRKAHRFHTPALAEVEQCMFSGDASASSLSPENIRLAEAPDRRAEVEHVARQIRVLLAQGLRLRDIAVLVRQLDPYHDLINAAFREHEIRYFVDRRRTMAHHPLLQFTRAMLLIAQQSWPHEAVMTLIKTGLCGLDARDADRLENYVLEHRLRGPVWARQEAWTWCRRLTRPVDEPQPQPAESEQIDALRRRVCEPLSPLIAKLTGPGTFTVRQVVSEIFQAFNRFGVREMLGRWIDEARGARQHEQAGEHEQVWMQLIELFDQLVDLMGQEQVTLAAFQEILEAGLETFDLALAPPTVDEVLVGQIDRTRTPEVKAVLLLGMNEGTFPYAPREASILSDGERLELQKRQFEVEAGSERRLLDENLLGYFAFTRSSQHLYASRCTADAAGRVTAPSPFWWRLRGMFPDLQVHVLPRDERVDPALVSTPRQLLTALMRWARASAENGSTTEAKQVSPPSPSSDNRGETYPAPAQQGEEVWPALYQWLATYPASNDAVDSLRHRVWKALSYDNSAHLSESIARALFPSPLSASIHQMESFAACPFKHFVRYGLRLEQRDESDVIEVDLENVFHRILDTLTRQMLRRGIHWTDLSPQKAQDLVDDYIQQMGQDLRGEMMLSSARNRYLLERIQKALGQVIAFHQAAAARGQFRTAFSKVDFGPGSAMLPPLVLPVPGGHELHLKGRIDRVDLLQDEGAFAVFNYRLWGGELNLGRVYHGLSLQLPAYLLVVQTHGEQLARRKLNPAAAFYARLLRQLQRVNHPSDVADETEEKFALRGKQRGIFDGQYFHALDRDGGTAGSDVVAGRLKKDGTFGYKDRSDVADTEELMALLEGVRKQLGRLAACIIQGHVDIRPYRIGTDTPCPSCPFKSVCRFDPGINRYRFLTHKGRQEVLKDAMSGGDDVA